MLRRIALILLPIALLAAACNGDGDSDGADDGTDTEPTATVSEPTTEPTTPEEGTDGDGGASPGAALLGSVNPFELLGSVGDPSTSADVEPSLKEPLLESGDLPDDYMALGEFTFSMPSEMGELDMAASMFAKGDLASEEVGPVVMSAAVEQPPEALAELGDPSELDDLTEEELAELEELKEMGLGEIELLDGSGLGDGGIGMRMEMDFGDLFGALGAPEEDNPFAEGIAMEMYVFLRGERMLMLMVMWPTGESPGVDARDLAEIMDARAADAF